MPMGVLAHGLRTHSAWTFYNDLPSVKIYNTKKFGQHSLSLSRIHWRITLEGWMIFAIFYFHVSDDLDHYGDFLGFFPYYFYFFQGLPRIQGGKHCDEGFKLARPNLK